MIRRNFLGIGIGFITTNLCEGHENKRNPRVKEREMYSVYVMDGIHNLGNGRILEVRDCDIVITKYVNGIFVEGTTEGGIDVRKLHIRQRNLLRVMIDFTIDNLYREWKKEVGTACDIGRYERREEKRKKERTRCIHIQSGVRSLGNEILLGARNCGIEINECVDGYIMKKMDPNMVYLNSPVICRTFSGDWKREVNHDST